MRFETWEAAHEHFARVVTTREANLQEETYEPGDNALKTYLIEVDGAARGDFEQKVQFLKAVSPKIFKRADVQISGRDRTLMVLLAEPKVYRRTRSPEDVLELEEGGRQPRPNAYAELYIDCSNDRFWRVFTDSRADVADPIVDHLTSRTAYLDRAWMPQQLLRRLPEDSILRGTRLDFNNFAFAKQKSDLDPTAIERVDLEELRVSDALDLKLEFKFKTNNQHLVNQAIDELSRSPFYGKYVSLTHLQVKRFSDPEVNAYTKSRIFFHGKMTSWGTDYNAHLDLMSYMYRQYEEQVTGLEDRYGIGLTARGGVTTVAGAPIVLELRDELTDLDAFVDILMDPQGPFRLSGIAEHLSPSLIRVRAVDLHVRRPIDLDVTPTLVTIYLERGSCGNTVLRLFTNIQRHFNANVKLFGGDGHELF